MNFSAMIGISYRNLSRDWCIHGILFKKVFFSQNSARIKKVSNFRYFQQLVTKSKKIDNVFQNDFLCVP